MEIFGTTKKIMLWKITLWKFMLAKGLLYVVGNGKCKITKNRKILQHYANVGSFNALVNCKKAAYLCDCAV